MTKTRVVLTALATGAAAWLGYAGPAHADNKGEARTDCSELMRDKGYKSAEVSDIDKRGDDRFVVEADATRKGKDRSVECVYDAEKDKAHLRK